MKSLAGILIFFIENVAASRLKVIMFTDLDKKIKQEIRIAIRCTVPSILVRSIYHTYFTIFVNNPVSLFIFFTFIPIYLAKIFSSYQEIYTTHMLRRGEI